MFGVWHFIPGVTERSVIANGSLEGLSELRLDPLFVDIARIPDDCVVVPSTVDGEAGIVLYPKTAGGDDGINWRGDACEWTSFELPGGYRRSVGIDPENLPNETTLRRRDQWYPDYSLQIAGEKWFAPCARSHHMTSSLPFAYLPKLGGDLEKRIAAELRYLWDLSGQFLLSVQSGDTWDEPTKVAAALTCLQVNYRVDETVVSALAQYGVEILTTFSVRALLSALVDNDTAAEWDDIEEQKKTPPKVTRSA